MIAVSSLKKIYHLNSKEMKKRGETKKVKTAVNGVSFEARSGQIFGLLGPNGAGKTTTLRCVSTLLRPTEGTVTVAGLNTVTQAQEVRKRLAFLTNELKLDGHFTPKYTMNYFGKLYGMKPEEIEQRKTELFEYFGISSFDNVKISDLSTGMKQKLSIAVSLIHDPEVVVFDEPTNGLDIITAKAVTDYLLKLKEQGKTIIVSTHIMGFAEKFCDQLAIILGGEIVASGTVQEVVLGQEATDLEDAFFKLYVAHNQEV
jgi:sodium transport system ATP-binding protein